MRVISQDGMVDLPYENIGISINHHSTTDIIAYPTCNYSSDSEFWIMALYSTEAKAKNAMKMLRTAYAGKFVTNADISEDFNERLKELMKGGFGTVLVKETNDCRVEFNNLNGYFQFPADEDVED